MMSMIENCLVTGARGLVGSTIDCEIKVGGEYDLRDQKITDGLFSKFKPNYVIHCAAKVGGLGSNLSFKGDFFYDNIMMNTNIIECSKKYDVKKLVVFLSTCIFPDKISYPLTEKQIHDGPPHDSNYAYAYAKRMVDIQIKSYNEQFGTNFISVVPTNIYGPFDNFSIANGHVIPSLIHKIYLAKKNKKNFEVWGSGKPMREFIFSEDVGKLTTWALKNYQENDPIIFSPSIETSIKNIVDIIAEEIKFNGKIVYDKTKPDGQLRKPTDNSKLLSYLPDFHFTPIEIGLKKTINWFIENYELARK